MKVNCPGCNTSFPVDDNRIPPQGTRVRCPRCFKAIDVKPEEAGGGSALEQALGVDLSGPAEAPASKPADGWGEIDDLSTKDISMLEGYKGPATVVAAEGAPAGGAGGPAPRPVTPAPQKPATPPVQKPATPPVQKPATPPVQKPAPQKPAPQKPAPQKAAGPAGKAGSGTPEIGTYTKRPQDIGGGVVDRVWPAGQEGGPAASAGPSAGPDEETREGFKAEGGEAAGGEDLPLDGAPAAEMTSPEAAGWHQAGAAMGGGEVADVVFDRSAAGKETEFAEPIRLAGFEISETATPEPKAPAEGGEDAPDSVFAMEERSGVFSKSVMGVGGPAGGGTEGFEPGSPVTTPPVGEESLFKRETVTREKITGKTGEKEKGKAPEAPKKDQFASGPTLDDIDFASLLDEDSGGKKGAGEGAGPAPAAAAGDVFFVESPSVPGGGSEAPAFETAKAGGGGGGGAFAMDEITFDDLGISQGGTAAAARPEAGSASTFDLDMGAAQPGTIPPLETMAGPAGAQAGAERKARAAPRRGKGVVVVVVVGLLGLGGGAGYMLGLFDSLLGVVPVEEVKESKQESRRTQFDTRLLATPSDYEQRLEILAKEEQLHPENKVDIQQEVLWELAWYRMLFPDNFSRPGEEKNPLEEGYQSLRKLYGGDLFKERLDAMEQAGKASWKEGDKLFQQYLQARERRMAELLESRKLTPQVSREDNILRGWFAGENGRYDEARGILKEQVEAKGQTDPYAKYVLARVEAKQSVELEGAKKLEEATACRVRAIDLLNSVLKQAPGHAASLLLLSEMLARDGKVDDAVKLASDCLEKAKTAKDVSLQIRSYRALAALYLKKGDKDKVYALLEEMKGAILEKKTGLPEPEDLLVALCTLYVERDLLEKALGTLELCKSCSSPEYYLLLATSYDRRKLYETALSKAQAGLEKYPKNIHILMLLSDLSKKTGHPESAVDYLERVLKLQPDSVDAALTLANLFLELKDPANARRTLMNAERFAGESLELEQKLAEINEAMGDEAGTATALGKILALKDDDKVRTRLVRILVRQGSYAEAIKHFEVLSARKLITPELRQDYARSLKAVGKVQDAVDVLKDLLKDNPGDVQTSRFLADIYLQKEDYYNAKIYLEATRRADSSNAEVHYLLGMCCLKLQDDACAREAFEQAVTLDPQRIDYAEQLANLLFKQSRAMPGQERLETMAKARKYFDYIIGRYEKDVTLPKDKRNPDVYFNRGTILFDTGHFAEALADIEKAMELAPQRYDVIVAYADSLFKSNRYDEAAKYYREMLDSKVEVAHAYFYLGRIYLLQNQREKAKENFLQCVRTNATAFPDAYRYLGDIYREKGLRKEAEANYRKYLKLVGENNPVAQDVLESLRRL